MLRYWMEQGMRMITYIYPATMIIDRTREVLKLLKDGLIEWLWVVPALENRSFQKGF